MTTKQKTNKQKNVTKPQEFAAFTLIFNLNPIYIYIPIFIERNPVWRVIPGFNLHLSRLEKLKIL